VSDKAGSSGGSFGIGKSAPFACSDLRTVFYATQDKDQEFCRNESGMDVFVLGFSKKDNWKNEMVKFYLLIQNNLHRRVLMSRSNSMKVFDQNIFLPQYNLQIFVFYMMTKSIVISEKWRTHNIIHGNRNGTISLKVRWLV
jgi:hypothetical protein